MVKFHNMPVITISVIMICAAVTATFYISGSTDPILFLYASESYGRNLQEIKHGQVWRLITPVFVHIDFFHWLFNMVCFWELGRVLERRYQWRIFLAFIVGFALPSNLAQYYATGPNFGGISAVLFAMLAFVWSVGKFNRYSDLYLPNYLALLLLAFFVLSWFGLFGQMSNVAHSVGLVCGLVTGYIFAKKYSTVIKLR
jgi:GlpG protein